MCRPVCGAIYRSICGVARADHRHRVRIVVVQLASVEQERGEIGNQPKVRRIILIENRHQLRAGSLGQFP
jgi:hypothetical protein